jgi:prephenate dehydratase
MASLIDSPPVRRLFTLGPEGTFSERAAKRVQRHFVSLGWPEASIEFTRTVPEVVKRTMAESLTAGVVPIENSSIGTLSAAEESLVRSDAVVEYEVSVRVRFRLLANAPLERVARLYAHPAAHEQCGIFLSERLSNAAVTFTDSNTDSGERLRGASAGDPAAAIVPIDYGDDLPHLALAEDIQDDPHNTTRFVIVRPRSEARPLDFSRWKASLVVDPAGDRPGLLHDVLAVFKRHDANLCRIESRPARTRPWEYVFHLDIHQNERGKEIAQELESNGWNVRWLGTFDAIPEE